VVDGGQPRQRRTVHYHGRVQGVGFRFTAERTASRFAVDGFVKNLPDGRVLVVVEGEPKELDRFLAKIQAEMAGNIRTIAVEPGPPTGEFSGFDVRY
jgi:acylphosphatase